MAVTFRFETNPIQSEEKNYLIQIQENKFESEIDKKNLNSSNIQIGFGGTIKSNLNFQSNLRIFKILKILNFKFDFKF